MFPIGKMSISRFLARGELVERAEPAGERLTPA
jgi:hypothetical protein